VSEAADRIVRERINEWRRHLIDLSYRNRLINYRRMQASTIEIESPALGVLLSDLSPEKRWRFFFPPEPKDEEPEEDSEAALFVDEAVVRQAQEGPAPKADEIVVKGEDSPHRINRILENLARKSNAEFEDKALRILYVAAGFLDWVDPTRGEALSSPLVLVPVQLQRTAAGQPYAMYFVDDEEIVVNPSLTEKLRRDLKLDVPEDWVWEDKPIETELAEIEDSVFEHGWTVRRDAALGLFSFQKFVMSRDLLANEDRIAAHPLVRSLGEKSLTEELREDALSLPRLDELDHVQRPEDDFCILDADATQRLCIEAAKRGQSFVMQGPPGTGKSQTIANMLADAIARGKRVLFVSEKAAALDVVHKRLAAQGLDEYCLLLHGEHAARREVVESLYRSLSSEIRPHPGMTANEMRRLTDLRELLNTSAEVSHGSDPKLGDRSLWDVLGELAALHDALSAPDAPEPSGARGQDVLIEFHKVDEVFQRLGDRWSVSPRSFPWRGFAGARFTTDDHGRVNKIVLDFADAVASVEAQAGDVARLLGWAIPANLRAAGVLLELGEHLDVAPPVNERWLEPGADEVLFGAAQEAKASFEARENGLRRVDELYEGRGISDFREDPAAKLDAALRELAVVIGRTRAWEERLVQALPDLRAFLNRAPRLTDDLAQAASEAAAILGQPAEDVSLASARRLAELAAFAFRTEDRPESDWLVRAGLERAQETLDEVRERLIRYQSESRRLLTDYRPSVLKADIQGLRARFAKDYHSLFSKLGGAYRRDVKEVKALRRDGSLPHELLQDLEDLTNLQALEAELEGLRDRLSRALGSYFRGVETDVEAASRACRAAERVLELAHPHSDLERLAAQVAFDSRPAAQIAQLADRLNATAGELVRGLERVVEFAEKTDWLSEGTRVSTLRRGFKGLAGSFRRVEESVEDVAAGSKAQLRTLGEVKERTEFLANLQRVQETIAAEEIGWRDVLGDLYRGMNTDWAAIDAAAAWLQKFHELLDGPIPPPLRLLLLSSERRLPDFKGLRKARAHVLSSAEILHQLFDDECRAELEQSFRQHSFEDLREWAQQLILHVDDLHDWVEFRAWEVKAEAFGWARFLDALKKAQVGGLEVVRAYRRAFWNRRMEALFAEEETLADRGASYSRWIREFCELDRRLVRTAADRVIVARNQSRSDQIAFRGSQVDLLKREAAKSRRHMPVRKLLASLPTLLSEIKPCLMMSPLTVSHFLSPEHQFDLVVFDEASQVPPQDAINCIYRGQQLVVAGDSHQLPPTSFFQVAEADETWSEDDTEIAEDMESILDACEALLPRHPLRWHYRSRHEHLIAFSNQHFYDGTMHTFPSADAFVPSKGVRFLYVPDAVYERGRSPVNRREARAVAERVIHHLREGQRSVGVIAFNTRQSDAVAEELERLRIEHPEFEDFFSGDRLDSVFVKHLESVQGDERDVIVFSIGFGRDASGRFVMNFGPLNKKGGFRRLNVAVTRARELVEVVASVRAPDFSLSENSIRGARLLQEYIRYAETEGRSLDAEERRAEEFASALEGQIAVAVKALGLEPEPEVGVGSFRVDVGVRTPDGDRYALGVSTDGEQYARTPTARDRERLRDEVLSNLRWRTHRVWALDWVRNRGAEVARLEDALEIEASGAVPDLPSAQDGEAELPGARERLERPVADLKDALDAPALSWVTEYNRIDLPKHNSIYEFHESINRDVQREMVISLAQGEAPIHVDYVIRRLARQWGLKRVGDRVRNAGRVAINMAERTGKVELRGEFIWLPGQELSLVRSPNWSDDRTFRGIEEIPPEEVDLAFEKLRDTGVTDGAELIPVVAKILGFDRVGAKIREVLEGRLAFGGADG
jgi:hypothetical protein